MKMEHVAINVSDPAAMAEWYKQNMGMELVNYKKTEPFTHFLRDSGGMMMIEIYKNPPEEIPDYKNMDPLLLHFAFVSEEPDLDSSKLIEAGASLIVDQYLEDGSHLIMLRDPWGLSIQLCKRAENLLSR